jgi:hypothetical protein
MIPRAEDVDREWLTERLRAAGHDAVVRGFRATRIGTGQIGKCIRFELDLERADAATPSSLVGKFPSDDPLSRATGVQLGNFVKEVSFYCSLQSSVSIRTPRCYYAEIDGQGPDFALLLEDLRPARQGDQLAGCSVAVARAAVHELVGLHAPHWCDAGLRGIPWLGESRPENAAAMRGFYQQLLGPFLGRYGARLERDEAEIIERVGASAAAPLFAPRPTTGSTTSSSTSAPIRRASRWSTGRASRSGRRSTTSPTSSAPASCRRCGARSRRTSCASTTRVSSRPELAVMRGQTAGRTTGAARSPASASP